MQMTEMVSLFLDSRKRGMTGARRKCSKATIHIYRHNLETFCRFLLAEVDDGGVTLYEGIRRKHLVAFLDWMDKKVTDGQWKKISSLQILRSLRTFFRWVDLDEDCQADGLKGLQRYLPAIEKNPRRLDIPESSELHRFRNGFDTKNRWGYRDYVAVSLLMDTGIRIGELCNLRIDHTRLEERVLIVDGKTGPRPVPITDEMGRLLKGWLKRRAGCKTAEGSDFVFISKYDPVMTVNGFDQRFRKHALKLGLTRITPHTFRHAFATNFLRRGGDIEKLRLIIGHQSFEMLKDYLHSARMGSKVVQAEMEKVSMLKEG